MADTKRRIILRMELSLGVPEKLNADIDLWGSSKVSVCSRVVSWLSNQDSDVQAAILGLLPPEYRIDVPRRVIEALKD